MVESKFRDTCFQTTGRHLYFWEYFILYQLQFMLKYFSGTQRDKNYFGYCSVGLFLLILISKYFSLSFIFFHPTLLISMFICVSYYQSLSIFGLFCRLLSVNVNSTPQYKQQISLLGPPLLLLYWRSNISMNATIFER